VTKTNSFEGLEEILDNENKNIGVEKTAKPPPISVDKVNNFSSLSQLLKKIATDEYEIKIMNKQTKIQSKSSIAYINIVKELKNKNRNFIHIKQSKGEALKEHVLVLKDIQVNPDNIKKEIENLEYIVMNIWNIKKQSTKKALHIYVKPKAKTEK